MLVSVFSSNCCFNAGSICLGKEKEVGKEQDTMLMAAVVSNILSRSFLVGTPELHKVFDKRQSMLEVRSITQVNKI